MENRIDGSTLIGDILKNYPQTMDILKACGMHCLGCPASHAEQLKDACLVHGLETELVVKALNEKIAALS